MLLDFGFSFFVLGILRLNRGKTALALSVSGLLWVIASCCGSDNQAGCFLAWLSAAAWITTFAGFDNRPTSLAFFPVFLPLFATPAGPIGMLTGVALNLPLPRKKSGPPRETYGIHRIPIRGF